MYFFKVNYKIYEWSKRASIFSVLGAILNAFCWICLCSVITLLINIPTATNPNYKEVITTTIPVVIILGIILALIGGTLKKKSEKLGILDFESKVKSDFLFAKKMAKKDPENKEWYINQNPEYATYVLSGNENLETNENDNNVKKIPTWRRILGLVLLAVFVFVILCLSTSLK